MWTEANIPDQTGRIVLITGANSGLGKRTAQVLAEKGAHIVMACRNLEKGEQARQDILKEVPEADLVVMKLDLGSLASIHRFAEQFRDNYDRIDLLYNNAGVMGVPRQETEDGFELQLGVNHLGHFALTGLLLDLMVDVEGSRIINLSSTGAWMGKMHFDDFQLEESYSRYGAYGQSKLANLLFTYELQRRLEAAGAKTITNAAHPGFTLTGLQHRAAGESGSRIERFIYGAIMRRLGNTLEMGTLAQLRAGTDPDAKAAAFYGPRRFMIRGYPVTHRSPKAAHNTDVARRLWEVSEQLTGVTYPTLERQPEHV